MIRVMASMVVVSLAAFLMGASPYSGMTDRQVKALSPEKIMALKSGGGAGYALAAELNGYPGPRHVLDLSEKLDLTPEQRTKTEKLFEKMRAEAIPLGKNLLELEAKLEERFQSRKIDAKTLSKLTNAIGISEALLRATHLKYHLEMANLMTAHQRVAYDNLRGYNSSSHRGRHGH
jgi:Spy/CpxP family protein refolding chaperone